MSRLLGILTAEGPGFYRVEHRWQPKTLMQDQFRRGLLETAESRLNALVQAESEFKGMEKADKYIGAIRRMQLAIKKAQFALRTDDLKFLQAVSAVFTDYGEVMRMLKVDQARGLLTVDPQSTFKP